MSDFLVHVAVIAALNGLLALSLNLQVGFGGLVNFGQIALFGCGAYGAALAFQNGWGPWAGLGLGLVLVSLLGLAFARLGRSLGSDYWGIATLAVAEILRTAATNETWLTGGAQGIGGLPQLVQGLVPTLAVAAAALAATWWGLHRITQSRFGLALRLLREEPQLAASLGYDLGALRRRVMLLAGVPAALCGFLYAHYVTFVGPDQLFAVETFLIWAMIVVGGLGNHAGAVVGAILLQALSASIPFAKDALGLSSEYVAAARLVLTGGGLLLFLLLRPEGLVRERIGTVHA